MQYFEGSSTLKYHKYKFYIIVSEGRLKRMLDFIPCCLQNIDIFKLLFISMGKLIAWLAQFTDLNLLNL